MRPLLALGVVAAAASIAAADTKPIAVEFVISGHETAMGNDQIELEDSPSRYPGMLIPLEHAMDQAPLSLPAGSLAGVITYADHNTIREPLRDVGLLTSAVLGTQKDYYMTIGTALVPAVEQGLAELNRVDAQHKFLVVIGDGTDTNMEAARPQLAYLREEAKRMGVEPVAIVYKNALSADETAVGSFDPHAMRAMTAQDVWLFAVQRIAVTETTFARAPEHPTCSVTSWFVNSRWQIALGSVLALLAMGGVWFVRRERM